jgi:hypothetical protein
MSLIASETKRDNVGAAPMCARSRIVLYLQRSLLQSPKNTVAIQEEDHHRCVEATCGFSYSY